MSDFGLPGPDGRLQRLSHLDEHELVVLVFLGTECPLARLYGARLAALAEEYGPRGVAFWGIDANRQDSLRELEEYGHRHGIGFTLSKDAGNRLADQLGATRTPEVFVLDRRRVVRYRGRIDDQWGVGHARERPSRHDLRAALDELLAGRPVSRPVGPAAGCRIGRARAPDPRSDVTYSSQISRLLQRRCVSCHREGEVAPFALTDYAEVAGWAETIAEVVHEGRMPPWHASPAHGSFANDRRLTPAEIALIDAWAAAGAPEGDPAELPEPLRFPDDWRLPRAPDAVLAMAGEPFAVSPTGPVRYQYFTVDPGFREDRWISAAEVRPGNRAVVHHVLVLVRPGGGGRPARARWGGGEVLAVYVPGLQPESLPPGMARRVPAGSQLVFQLHYTPIGSPQEDLSRLGLVFADPERVTYEVFTGEVVERSLDIPPHSADVRVEATSSAHDRDALLLSLMPHMHLRGAAFRYEALYPDGRRETLLDVPRYDFDWQTSYRLAEPRTLPAGTRIHCEARFDNSAANPRNPDPSRRVRWGEQTVDEMMVGYFDFALPREPAPAETPSAAERRARDLVARFDDDGDGRVARDEVPERLAGSFERIDGDGDGFVTLDELRALE